MINDDKYRPEVNNSPYYTSCSLCSFQSSTTDPYIPMVYYYQYKLVMKPEISIICQTFPVKVL